MGRNTTAGHRPELNPKNILSAAFGKKWKKLRTKKGKYLLDQTTLSREDVVTRINNHLTYTCYGALDCKSFDGLCTLVAPPVYDLGVEGVAVTAWSLNSLFEELERKYGKDDYPNINLDDVEPDNSKIPDSDPEDFLSTLYNNGKSHADSEMTPIDMLAEIISSAFPEDERPDKDSEVGRWAPDFITENGTLVSQNKVAVSHNAFVEDVNLRLCKRGLGTLVSKGAGKRATVLLKPVYGAGFPGEIVTGDNLVDALEKMEVVLDSIENS